MLRARGLYGHIRNNNIKSMVLLFGFLILIGVLWLCVTAVWTGLEYKFMEVSLRVETTREPTWTELSNLLLARWTEHSQRFAFIPAIVVTLWFAYAYVRHSALIREATGASFVSRTLDARLYNLVENLTIAAGMPMPRVEIMEIPALNAYASGLSPKSASIAVTRGLIEALNDDELEAVLAHELTHVRNRDVRLMVVATIFVGMLSIISYMMLNGTAKTVGRASNGGGGIGVIIIVAAVVIAAIAGFFGVLTRFAISRSREYMADAGSAELTKNPEALIAALRKIAGHDEIEGLPPSMQAMMISANVEGLFATHPTVEARIDALERYAGALPAQAPRREPRARPQSAPQPSPPSFGRRGAVAAAAAAAPQQRTFGRREQR